MVLMTLDGRGILVCSEDQLFESSRSSNIMVHLGKAISWNSPHKTDSHPCTLYHRPISSPVTDFSTNLEWSVHDLLYQLISYEHHITY